MSNSTHAGFGMNLEWSAKILNRDIGPPTWCEDLLLSFRKNDPYLLCLLAFIFQEDWLDIVLDFFFFFCCILSSQFIESCQPAQGASAEPHLNAASAICMYKQWRQPEGAKVTKIFFCHIRYTACMDLWLCEETAVRANFSDKRRRWQKAVHA